MEFYKPKCREELKNKVKFVGKAEEHFRFGCGNKGDIYYHSMSTYRNFLKEFFLDNQPKKNEKTGKHCTVESYQWL